MVKLTKREKLRKKVAKLFNVEEQKEFAKANKTDPGQPKLATTIVQMPTGNGVTPNQTPKQSAIKLKFQMYSPNHENKKSTTATNATTTTAPKSSVNGNSTKLNNGNGNKNVIGDRITNEALKAMGKQKKSNEKFSPYTKSPVKDNKPKQVTTSKDMIPAMIELKFNEAQGGDTASASASTVNKRQSAAGHKEKTGTTSKEMRSSNGTSPSSSSAISSSSKSPVKKTQKSTNLPNSNPPNKVGNGCKTKVPLKRPALAKKPKVQQKRMKLSSQKQTEKKDDEKDSISLMDIPLPGYVPSAAAGPAGEDRDDSDEDETCSDDSHEYHPFNDHHKYSSSDEYSYSEIETDDLSSEEKCNCSSENFSEPAEFDLLNHFTYECNDSFDADYTPPIDIPEDLIIHKGTATKYEIPQDEPVLLCSDNDEPHVVEMPTDSIVVSIKQPKGYDIDALHKLNEMFEKVKIDLTTIEFNKNNRKENIHSSSCPELVPVTIADLDSYLQTEDSSDEHYEEMSEDGSVISEDINAKYMASEVSSCCDSNYDDLEDDDEPPVTVTIVEDYKSPPSPPIKFDDNNLSRTPSPIKDDFSDFETTSNCKEINVPMVMVATLDKSPSTKISQDSFKSVLALQSAPSTDECASDGIPPGVSTLAMSTEKSTQSRNIFCNAINSNDVLVLLKDEIYIYGTVRLTLVYGTTDVYGYIPEKHKAVEIYSPRGCSLVQITPKHSEIAKKKLETILKQYEETFTHANLKEILKNYTLGVDAVLLLQRNDGAKKLVNNFKKFMSENVFPNMKSLPTDHPNYASEYLLQCFINNTSDKGLQVSPEWQNIKLHDETKMLIAGGKSVGKSTLLRYLVNRNLKKFPRILIIDLDIGQSELFIPQTVSCTIVTDPLLGPGFFLKHQPAKAFMVGHVNVALCAETYMRAVKELLEYCHSQLEYAALPWLINTMGYNKGFGLELFACIADYVRPTDIVQLQSNKDINNFSEPLKRNALKALPRIIFGAEEFKSEESAVEPACKLHVLYSAVMQQSRYQKEWDMSAKDLRYAMLVARLSGALQGNAEWLTDCIPLSAPLNSIKFVNMLTREGTRDELLAAVETNLVYLCQMEVNPNAPLECFGIGIVRGVDHNVNQVYLLPATYYNRLQNVNCLALGEMPLPNSLFINQGPKVRGIAPFVYSTVDANASKAVKQIYHRPSEFLTGVHREI